jgi:hypothetical protein
MKNKKIIGVVAALVLLGAGFGGGYAYAKSQSPRGQFGTFSVNGQAVQFGGRAGGATLRTGANGGFTAGEIITKDANSITVKMQDGSTKIILVGSSAQILKQISGTTDDLVVGQNVTITGSSNSDGSITAQSIQLHPAGMGLGTTTRTQ